jgi:hypothetical protein
MAASSLNLLGSILGMLGVVVILIWGPEIDRGVALGLEPRTRLFRFTLRSKLGLGLIFLGFLSQALAVVISP